MKILHIDFETRSDVDLKNANAYVYFDSPHADVMCAAWAFDNDEPQIWVPGDLCPEELSTHVASGGIIAAWNAAFERIAWRKIMGPKYGWPVPDLRQYRCVMVQSYSMAMPGKLEMAAPALGVEERKDAAGKRVMEKLCKPRRSRRWERDDIHWHEDPADLEILYEYCKQDVRTETACYNRLPPLSDKEQQLWFLDQEMNDRGVYLDVPLIEAAQTIIQDSSKRLDEEMRQVTDMAVRGVGNVSELIGFVRKHGVETDSIAKEELAALLVRADLPPAVRRALEIRQEGAKTSTAKIRAMLDRRQADGRMRGTLQFHGATTGRWAARGAQLHNLPRPSIKVTPEVIEDVLTGRASYVEMLHGPAMTVVSDCIRGMVRAAPGKKIIAADFSQIEARVTAWLSGQSDVLDAFRAYDAGTGPDVYTTEAAKIYREPITKDDPRRQVGKVAVLALGFGGGAMALLKMAKNYRLDIGAAFESVLAADYIGFDDSLNERRNSPRYNKAMEAWDQRGKKSGVAKGTWITAEMIKLAWRDANPFTVLLWKETEAIAIHAVTYPGSVCTYRKLQYKKAGSWLFCRLPSGRTLAYAYPKIESVKTPWVNDKGEPVYKESLTYWAMDGVTNKWGKVHAYGGMLVQHAVQGTARDIMADGMTRAGSTVYAPILTVHDEVVVEVDADDWGTVGHFCAMMTDLGPEYEGLPITADGWSGERYRK